MAISNFEFEAVGTQMLVRFQSWRTKDVSCVRAMLPGP
jgi:hypothetical protein